MAVKIRFSRIGKKHAPVYRIVAVDSRKKRDGKCLENLGTYNPLTKEIVQFHDERVAYWISVGAVVADSVKRLMKFRKKSAPKVAPVKKEEAKAEKKVAKAAPKTTKKVAAKETAKAVEKKAAPKAASKKEAAQPKEKEAK